LNYNSQISEDSSSEQYCTWMDVEILVEKLAHAIQRSHKKYDLVLAITNGGIIPGRLIARDLNLNHIQLIPIRNKKLYVEEMLPLFKGRRYLVVDDIYDTGYTFNRIRDMVKEFDCDFAFLMTRFKNADISLVAKVLNHKKWIVFPWERKRS
jgi:hypoxanthine phosphoribosyltransferase